MKLDAKRRLEKAKQDRLAKLFAKNHRGPPKEAHIYGSGRPTTKTPWVTHPSKCHDSRETVYDPLSIKNKILIFCLFKN